MNFTHHEFSLSIISPMDELHLSARKYNYQRLYSLRVVCFLVTCTFFYAFFRSITRHDDSANFFLFYFVSCVVPLLNRFIARFICLLDKFVSVFVIKQYYIKMEIVVTSVTLSILFKLL